jgi:Domain of unknown function (DUF5011)
MMKKFLMAIFMFSFMFSFSAVRANENTSLCEVDSNAPEIEGPSEIYYQVNDTEKNYQDLFTLKDDCSEDIGFSYQTSKDYNLNEVGQYKMTVFATDFTNSSNRVIDIYVYETIGAPELAGFEDKTLEVHSTISDEFFLQGVTAVDFRGVDITEAIQVDYSQVNTSKKGVYPVTYQVTDLLEQDSEAVTIYLEIEDTLAPTIELIKDIKIDVYGEHPNYQDYLKVTDLVDSIDHLTIEFDKGLINRDVIGEYTLPVKVTDTSGNTATLDLTAYVVDQIAPVIDLQDKEISINVNEEITFERYVENILVSDNYDTELNVKRIKIDEQYLLSDTEGVYPVYYSISDSSGNITTQVIYITVVDDEFPVIEGVKPITVTKSKENKLGFDLLEGVTASYNGSDISNQILVDDSNVNYTTPGTYYITYYVNDMGYTEIAEPSRIITTVTIEEDKVAPELTLKDSIDLEVHTSPNAINFEDYILSLTDNYNDREELTLTINPSINYHVIGSYQVKYHVMDEGGNLVEKTMTVNVVDTTEANATVTGPIVMEVNGKKANYMNFITVSDNYWLDDNIHISYNDASVNYKRVGDYRVIYTIEDASGNTVEKEVQVKIVDTKSPVLTGVIDRETKEGRKINLLEGVLAMDEYDGNITHKIMTVGDYDFDQEGTYTVYFKVIDASGNETLQSFNLTVQNNPTPLIVKIILSSCGLFMLGFYIFTKIQDHRMKDWM